MSARLLLRHRWRWTVLPCLEESLPRNLRRRTLIASLAAAVVLAGTLGFGLSYMGDSFKGELVAPGENPGRTGGKGELPRPGSRGTLVLHQLCVRGVDHITLTSVQPEDDTGGLVISDFAVLEPSGSGEAEGWVTKPLSESQAAGSSKTVTADCSTDSDSRPSLVIEVQAPKKPLSSFYGLEVRYDRDRKTLKIPFDMAVCQIDLDAPACNDYDFQHRADS